jgi:hypothetical protein
MGIQWRRPPRKLIVITVLLALIGEIILYSVGGVGSEGSAIPFETDNSNDRRIAAELSNMSGVEAERILSMKASGKSWNDIMESLKTTDGQRSSADKEKRSLGLLGAGLGEEAVARLVALGYAQTDIAAAKLLAERIALQINQLVEENMPEAPKIPAPTATWSGGLPPDDKESFVAELRSVAERFELETAVRLMLSLKREFGSYEAVLDEYLTALQLGLNLDEYAADKTRYEKDKQQKKMEKVGRVDLTLSEIERRLLDRIREENASGREASAVHAAATSTAKPSSESVTSPLPEAPTPKIKDVKPVNPAEAVKEELRRLDPNIPANGR